MKAEENLVDKGENAGYQYFLLFPQCFLLLQIQFPSFQQHFICPLEIFLLKTSLKILLFGKELTLHQKTQF